MVEQSMSQYIRQNQGKEKESLILECQKKFGKQRDAVLDTYRKAIKGVSVASTSPVLNVGVSEAELRAKHDNLYKIRQGVKQLEDGRYLTDQQMREFCKVNTSKWRSFADNVEFDKFKIKVSGDVTYWGTPKCVLKLHSDLNLL